LHNLDDTVLMLKVRQGEVDYLGLLFERHHQRLFGFFYRLTSDPATSEDLVQNVFYRVLRYRGSFRDDGDFCSWLYHLARNVHADHYQKGKKNGHHRDVGKYDGRLPDDSPPADELLQHQQEQALLAQALGGLPQEQREVLIMSKYQELKYSQIAQVLGCTEENVKVKVHRALKKLREVFLKIS
jgi:RNA polymerase sigma factor (sigma-70 family)